MRTSLPYTNFLLLLLLLFLLTLTLTHSSQADTSRSQDDVTTLTTDAVRDCVANNSTLTFSSRQLLIDSHYLTDGNNRTDDDDSPEVRSCTVNLTTSSDKVFQVIVEDNSVCRLYKSLSGVHQLTVIQGDHEKISECGSPARFFSFSNRVSVLIVVNSYKDLSLLVNLTAVPAEQDLISYFPTSWKGYVETPGLSEGIMYPGGPLRRKRLDVPAGYVVMVSFLHLLLKNFESEFSDDAVTFYVDGDSEKHVQWTATLAHQPPVKVYEARSAVVQFHSKPGSVLHHDTYPDYPFGFRILVTYHKQDERPAQEANGSLWNCSVPFWPQFRAHFLCNLEKDCVNGEDESQCPYITDTCGPDMVTVGDNCYFLLNPAPHNTTLSWNQARKRCVAQGGRLASLNTPQEWRDVTEVVQRRRRSNLFMGLHYNRYHLPNM